MIAHLWWIFHKDLVTEFRARRVWPTMLLLGLVVGVVFSLQMDLLPQQKQQLVGGLLWLAIFFAGLTALDRSFAAEREDGCWEGLRLYPLSPTTVYFAKLAANAVALVALQAILIPLFLALYKRFATSIEVICVCFQSQATSQAGFPWLPGSCQRFCLPMI